MDDARFSYRHKRIALLIEGLHMRHQTMRNCINTANNPARPADVPLWQSEIRRHREDAERLYIDEIRRIRHEHAQTN